VKRP